MKRSIAKAITMKQSSAYSRNRSSAPAIHQIDGSSRREASRIKIKPLKSFGSLSGVSESILDAQAEKIMSAGYKRSRNPICSSCFTAKANNGSCGCS